MINNLLEKIALDLSLIPKINDQKLDKCINQGFTKLEILICFNSSVIEHWILLHQALHIFPIPLSNWAIFVTLEALGGRLQMFLQL